MPSQIWWTFVATKILKQWATLRIRFWRNIPTFNQLKPVGENVTVVAIMIPIVGTEPYALRYRH